MTTSTKSAGWNFLKDQQEVQEWIEQVQNYSFKNDFAGALYDGTLLCSIALSIEERTIPKDKVFTIPRNRSQVSNNIFLFLEACKDFGVPRSKLFKDTDLMDRKNMPQVVNCLRALADVLITTRKFPIVFPRLKEEEVDYPAEDVAAADKMILKLAPAHKKVSGASVEKRQIELAIQAKGWKRKYQNKKKLTFQVEKFIKIVTKIQAIFRSRRVRGELKKRAQAFRDNIAKEILHTEETYVAGLQNLVNNYKKPLQKEVGTKKEYIDAENIKAIFSDVEIILGYNTALLEELKPRISKKQWGPSTCLGDIFLKITKFLKVYTSYVKNYDEALNALANCKKTNEKFKLEEEGGNLEMLLILPIQRIPRYNMLLEQLVKHTWPDHQDSAHLKEAYTTMKDVALYVNEKKREFESIAKVREIQNAFTGKTETLISPNRKFIRSDVVALWAKNMDEKKPEQVMVTLFNDLIVVSTPNKKGTLKWKEAIRIANVRLKEPKLRKWATKRMTLTGKEGLTGGTTATPEKDRRDSVSYDSPGKGGTMGSLKKDAFSAKNTIELINSKEEPVLKVCMDSAIFFAEWTNDFRKAKEELDQIDAQKTERAKKMVEATKSSITMNMLKSRDEKRQLAGIRTSTPTGETTEEKHS